MLSFVVVRCLLFVVCCLLFVALLAFSLLSPFVGACCLLRVVVC